MNRHHCRNSILLVLLIMVCNAPVFCQLSPKVSKLQGLTGIERVLIEGLSKHAEDLGLTKEQLQTEVEVRLRKAGIRITNAGYAPFLYVNVNILAIGGRYIYSIDVSLQEPVLQKRRLNLDFQEDYVKTTMNIRLFVELSILASTWDSGSLGFATTNTSIRERLASVVDEFINDYLAANPK